MFGIGVGEWILILLAALLLFGARRLPEVGKGLGTGLRSFRDALRGEVAREATPDERADDHEKPQ